MSWSPTKGPFLLMIALMGAASCSNDFSASSAGTGGTDAAVSMTGGASGKPNGSGGAAAGGAPTAGTPNEGGGGSAGKGAGGTGGRGIGGDADSGAVGTAGKGTGAADAGDGGESGDAASDANLSPSIPADGLILWLRADRGVTAQSSLVSRWTDQSPAHADAAQDVTRSRPVLVADGINGRPALLFDGTDDFLQLDEGFGDFSMGISIFTVMNTTLEGEVCAPVFEASNGEEIDDIHFGPNHDHVNYEVFNDANLDVACLPDVPQLFSVVQDKTGTFEVRRDGLFGTLSTFPPPAVVARKAVFVGKSLYSSCKTFAGRIGEVIVYARALSDAEARGVESYLQQQYGCCSK
jgi:hypothetical protein